MISDEKVGPKGVRVRCKKCGNVIPVRRPVENGAAAAEQPVLATASTPTPVPGGLDVELGQAFEHAFGEGGATAAEAAAVTATAPATSSTPVPAAEGADPLPVDDEPLSPAVNTVAPARTPAPSRTPAPAPAAPAATEWYVAIGQAQVGPLPLEEVRRKWEVADVGPDSLVWRPGMGDWAPLSSVSDLAAYLAPFPVSPRQSRTPAPASSPARAAGAAATPVATPAPGADVSWKPVGASALAALASEEIATRTTPEPRPVAHRAPEGGGGVRTLIEEMDLPDGGGVDPTGAIPLPMKALEATGEHRMERISSVARGAEEIRHRRSAARGIAIAAVVLLVLGGGAAALWYSGVLPGSPRARTEPTLAVAPAPAPQPAVATQPEPAPVAAPAPAQPSPGETAQAQGAAAAPEPAQAAQPEAPPAAPAQAAATPEAEPEKLAPAPEPAQAAEPPAKVARPTASPARITRREREAARLAKARAAAAPAPAAAAAPAPAPSRRRDVLDFESNDAALEAALGSTKPSGSRSVYVPPPPSGSALQERIPDSQVNETILGRVPALQQCVQQQKARDPDASGVLKMRWAIAPDGSVRDPKCVTPEFASSAIAQCVSGVLRTTRFPKSKLGRQDVTFPIKF